MRVRVEFDVEIPEVGATDDQIIEWLRFNLHDNGSMRIDNPLGHAEPEPCRGSMEILDKDQYTPLYG
jgi:hypothetical protein